ncbi:MAG: hypothetical protein HPKKFMNG_02863 [Planctomycetes bacterium]|nr:hypothetical protein [Planctomycetota bacterium]
MKRIALISAALLLAMVPALGQKNEPAKPATEGKVLEYKDGDTTCEGYLAAPAGQATGLPAVLIVHDWMGLKQLEQEKADGMAAAGYVALAVDMYGKGVRPKNTQEAQTQAMKFYNDAAMAVSRITAALETLKKQPGVDSKRIGIFGYCFGGSISLALARSGADIAACISFHGALKNIQGKSEIKCPVLVLHGADDPLVPQEDVSGIMDEFRKGSVDWQLVHYGNAVHSFTNPKAGNDNSRGAAYNAKADKRSWEILQDFLAETLKP